MVKMSDDVIGWYEFKDINLRKNLDINLANLETIKKIMRIY